ncbi:tudor domain-containing protein 10 isoform X2 [Ambystoma mexicanum]
MEISTMSANSDHEFVKQTKNGSPESPRNSMTIDGSYQVYVGNLPVEATEFDILQHFKDFNPQHVRKCQNGIKCFAFVHLTSVESQQQAIERLHETSFSGRRLLVRPVFPSNDRKNSEHTNSPVGLPALESITTLNCNGSSIEVNHHTPDSLKPKKTCYAVPLEMRGYLLVNMLKDCFKHLNWIAFMRRRNGDAALLVTDTFPKSPFFWAMYLTEEVHLNMLELFKTLADVESTQPFLQRKDVKRGTRCLAECNLGDGEAWNRCWVMEVIEDLSVVFFVDFGRSATVLAKSLRSLENMAFWQVPPLTQPFMLQDGIFNSENIVGSILKGKINGCCENECHILKFAKTAEA